MERGRGDRDPTVRGVNRFEDAGEQQILGAATPLEIHDVPHSELDPVVVGHHGHHRIDHGVLHQIGPLDLILGPCTKRWGMVRPESARANDDPQDETA